MKEIFVEMTRGRRLAAPGGGIKKSLGLKKKKPGTSGGGAGLGRRGCRRRQPLSGFDAGVQHDEEALVQRVAVAGDDLLQGGPCLQQVHEHPPPGLLFRLLLRRSAPPPNPSPPHRFKLEQ